VIGRRIQEAHFPKVKTLEEFEFLRLRRTAEGMKPNHGDPFIDEMTSVAIPEAAAELLFQVISGRARGYCVVQPCTFSY
jgi:hypothetical protein